MNGGAGGGAATCAREVLEVAPALIWYIRLHMRKYRRGLSVPQFRALVKVRNFPATSVSAVAEHLDASLPTTSRLIATLVKRGYLTRCGCSADRRQLELRLTDAGRRMVDEAMAATQRHMEEHLGGLTGAQRAAVRDAMVALKAVFDGLRAEGACGGRPARG